ncbi:MAG: DUF6345 domain-containing protein [Chitinophagaceae bacterium]
MKHAITKTLMVFAVIALSAMTATAGFREIGGYVDKAESRFVRNVWNFVKEFQSNQNIGSHSWRNTQYYWAEPRFFQGASHTSFTDAMDMVFCSGHGNFYIWETNQSTGTIIDFRSASPFGDLPNNGDLEFMTIESCNTVTPYPDDNNYRNSWRPMFAGMHQLVGFRTLSVSDNGIPNRYARKLKGNGGVWQSWFESVNDERYWIFNPTLSDGAPYPGFASAVVYYSTENDRLGSYASTDPFGTSGMHSWWQY